MRVLGIDHGTKRIGVAISDESGRIAHPHSTIAARPKSAAIAALADLIEDRDVDRVVVGLPLMLDGTEGRAAQRVRAFGERVRAALGDRELIFWDERMTSVVAERALIEGQVRRSGRKQAIDRVAAALLLQNYLDSIRPRPSAEEEPR